MSPVDANVLVYASNEAEPVHETARALVERLAAGPEIVYLFWPAIMGYLRIVTHPSLLPRPLSPKDAIANLSALIAVPHVRTPGEHEGFWELYLATRGKADRGNDMPDGHLRAITQTSPDPITRSGVCPSVPRFGFGPDQAADSLISDL